MTRVQNSANQSPRWHTLLTYWTYVRSIIICTPPYTVRIIEGRGTVRYVGTIPVVDVYVPCRYCTPATGVDPRQSYAVYIVGKNGYGSSCRACGTDNRAMEASPANRPLQSSGENAIIAAQIQRQTEQHRRWVGHQAKHKGLIASILNNTARIRKETKSRRHRVRQITTLCISVEQRTVWFEQLNLSKMRQTHTPS